MRWIGFILALLPATAHGQLHTDTLFTWQGYTRESLCRLRWYAAGDKAKKPHIIILGEHADNRGPSTLADVSYLAENASRMLSLDPTEVLWIIHWGNFSFRDAARRPGKEMFLRATFRRTSSGRLSAPQWKVVSREEVGEMTDWRFQ